MNFGTFFLLVTGLLLVVGIFIRAVSKNPEAPSSSAKKQMAEHIASPVASVEEGVECDDDESYHFRQLGFGMENYSVAALGRDDD